jgi:hypothetical protein
LKELVAVVEKLNELALNDSDLDEETDLDDSLKEINCTQDEFININNQKRVLPDLLSNQSIHLLDQTQSHEVKLINLFIYLIKFILLVSTSSWKSSSTNNINNSITNVIN